MPSIQQDMLEFRRQLQKGSIQKAYKALLAYMMDLQADFKDKVPSYGASGLYHGYLDMTYFAIFPQSLKARDLKIAIVFNYGAFRFEAWLAGSNRKVQHKYWELFRDSQWDQYRVVAPATGVDSIVECDLAEDVDFGDLDSLTSGIEGKTIKFIEDIERFLSDHQPA